MSLEEGGIGKQNERPSDPQEPVEKREDGNVVYGHIPWKGADPSNQNNRENVVPFRQKTANIAREVAKKTADNPEQVSIYKQSFAATENLKDFLTKILQDFSQEEGNQDPRYARAAAELYLERFEANEAPLSVEG